MKTISKKQFLEILEWAMVIVISLYMIVYGSAKYIQFGHFSEYTKPLNSHSGMELMWAFYSYSKPFVVIIGMFEILGAILFVIPKTRILGGFLLSTILVNIILQDSFYGVNIGALIYAICFQIMIFIVFYFHKTKILNAFKFIRIENTYFNQLKSLKNILILLFLVFMIYILLSSLTHLTEYLIQ